MTGAQAIIESLKRENVKVMFGYPGATICPFYDALIGSGLRHVLSRYEQGAVNAASGYARVTGKVGVCVATSGPGATNMITGIATAYMDSIPIVAITGQVSSELIGRDVFQEADITGATIPFCKHSYLVKRADDLPRVIREAFHIASTGRPGPVLIDVPVDVQKETIEYNYPEKVAIRGYKPTYKGHAIQIKKAAEAITSAKRPVICAGGGVISAEASQELVSLAEKCNIPVATTLMGIGSIPSTHRLYLGMIGSHGSRAANRALNNTDLLVVVGARLGDRAMGAAKDIAEKATVIHMDIDPAEIGKNIDTAIPIVGDVRNVLTKLHELCRAGSVGQWVEELGGMVKDHNQRRDLAPRKDSVNPKLLLGKLSGMIHGDAVITTEVGQNQIWAANNYKVMKPRAFLTSGGMGTMGYGLPSAIGAKIGRPGSPVIVISGDGSFQMSIQELGTIRQEKLDIKIIIFNNSRLGMVRELQKTGYGCRYSQVFLDSNPDFIKIANAYGFKGDRLATDDGAEDALEKMLASKGTYILECIVDPEESTL